MIISYVKKIKINFTILVIASFMIPVFNNYFVKSSNQDVSASTLNKKIFSKEKATSIIKKYVIKYANIKRKANGLSPWKLNDKFNKISVALSKNPTPYHGAEEMGKNIGIFSPLQDYNDLHEGISADVSFPTYHIHYSDILSMIDIFKKDYDDGMLGVENDDYYGLNVSIRKNPLNYDSTCYVYIVSSNNNY